MGSIRTTLPFFLLCSVLLSGCQITYYAHTGYNQGKLLLQRKKIDEVLKDPNLPKEKAEKLRLALDAKEFSVGTLGLKPSKSYETYVDLNRKAVTYVVQVAYTNRLEHHNWWYPIVGSLPYKGFFAEDLALNEAKKFDPKKYDTFVRGVRAYSTLGWFNDPLTSPMLDYEKQDLVETIIHELTHSTLFIKSQAEFNERLATFIGVEGAKRYFIATEGQDSKTTKSIIADQKDLEEFSKFMSEELKNLKTWYEEQKEPLSPENKKLRLEELKTKFVQEVIPRLKGQSFKDFSERKLNNAILLSYQTYISDLEIFDELLKKLNGDLKKFIQEVKKLEKSKEPEADLRGLISGI